MTWRSPCYMPGARSKHCSRGAARAVFRSANRAAGTRSLRSRGRGGLFFWRRPDLVYAFLPTQTTLATLLLPLRLKSKLVFGLRAGGVQLDQYDALNAL